MTPLIQDYESLLAKIRLQKGQHEDRSNGLCIMETAAYIAGEAHSDHPVCASPVITSFLISWNDSLPSDEDRERLLKPLVQLVVDTRTTAEDDQKRSYMALDWLIRECAPTFLALTPSLVDHAEALRSSPEVTTPELAKAIGTKAAAARAAARAAALDAARASLKPAVESLQASAVLLVRRMCEVGR